jgi:UDP-N-acetylmuramate--alanine ligase
MPVDGTVVANVGDPGVAAIVARLTDRVPSVLPIILTAGPDVPGALVGRILAQEPAGTTIALHLPDARGAPLVVRLPTAGQHNAANALGVAGAALTLGVPPQSVVRGLETFAGVGRRLERKGEAQGVVVYDDYGHHPTAIRATIAAMRQREPERRLWAVYEPLTYHRTAALLGAFADALATADAVAIADIWAGRDPDTTIASASGLATAVAERRADIPVEAPGSVEATADRLAAAVRPGDAVLVMGGGHSYRIATGLLRRLEETSRR